MNTPCARIGTDPPVRGPGHRRAGAARPTTVRCGTRSMTRLHGPPASGRATPRATATRGVDPHQAVDDQLEAPGVSGGSAGSIHSVTLQLTQARCRRQDVGLVPVAAIVPDRPGPWTDPTRASPARRSGHSSGNDGAVGMVLHAERRDQRVTAARDGAASGRSPPKPAASRRWSRVGGAVVAIARKLATWRPNDHFLCCCTRFRWTRASGVRCGGSWRRT